MVQAPPTVYDPKRTIVTYGPIPMAGYAPGTYVRVTRNAVVYRTITGTNGEYKRIRTRNRSGTVEVTLRGTSPVNRLLSIIAQTDENGGSIFAPISIADTLNGGLFFGRNAYIDRYPAKSYGLNEGDTTWSFRCEDLVMTFPGASAESVAFRV